MTESATTIPTILTVLETYYDAAPRPLATTEEVGPFTLFGERDADGWPYYARPRLGSSHTVTAADVAAVRARQREVGVPEALEWVHQTTPSLLAATRETGLTVHECPLLVLGDGAPSVSADAGEPGGRVVMLPGDSADLGPVGAAVHAGFGGVDETEVREPPARHRALIADGLLAQAGAFDDDGEAVGGGGHSPRADTTELLGIAVLPRARRRGFGAAITRALAEDARTRGVGTVFLSAQDDAVARVYERVGFVRVGTACIAEPA